MDVSEAEAEPEVAKRIERLRNKLSHLKAKHGKKIAVIENEFGDVGIDDALLKPNLQTQTDEDVIEMMNGCICAGAV